MKEKKNIDRLFQEKFKDFEAQPGTHVWESIAARQNQKRKKVIPLWFKLGGVAALLALLLTAGNFWFTENTSTPQVVQEEQTLEKQRDSLEEQKNFRFANETETIPEDTDNAIQSEEKDSKTTGIVSGNSNLPAVDKSKPNSATVKPGTYTGGKPIVSQSKDSKSPNQAQSNLVAKNSSDYKIQDTPKSKTETIQDAVVVNEDQQEENLEKESTDLEIDPDELLRIANREEGVAVDNSEKKENGTNKRWGLSPIVAPVYYGDFGGSGIDPQFANNTKKGDVNFSYGVQLTYALNDKFKLRAGVNKVDLGYRTEQVAFSPSIQANSIKSVDYVQKAGLIQVSSLNKNSLASPSPNLAEFRNNSLSSSSNLHQQLGYIEVPLEAEYAIISKKIGLQLIGGFSTLFLNNNMIVLEDGNNFSSELGASNSLNNTSFSTNIGLGFDYKITPALEFNLEPMFKYQLNAYTNGVSDFKPYYMGLYTGINLKF